MTETNFEMIQNLVDLASNLQGKVNKFEQEKKQQVNQWEEQAKCFKENHSLGK